MRAGVDLGAEVPARLLKFSEGGVGAEQFASVGTRSALAMRTVASEPPLDCGSAGTQVRIVMP